MGSDQKKYRSHSDSPAVELEYNTVLPAESRSRRPPALFAGLANPFAGEVTEICENPKADLELRFAGASSASNGKPANVFEAVDHRSSALLGGSSNSCSCLRFGTPSTPHPFFLSFHFLFVLSHFNPDIQVLLMLWLLNCSSLRYTGYTDWLQRSSLREERLTEELVHLLATAKVCRKP